MIGFLVKALICQGNFARIISGIDMDAPRSACESGDGGLVLAGHSYSSSANGYDCMVVKIGSTGSISWASLVGRAGFDFATSVENFGASGFIVAGYTNSYGAGGFDGLLMSLDANGGLAWSRVFGGERDEFFNCLIRTRDGGFIIAGSTQSFGSGARDCFLIKLSADGNTLWAKSYGWAGEDYGSAVMQASDGGYTLVGRTNSFGGDDDILVLKVDPAGNPLWTRVLRGAQRDRGYCILEASDAGIIVGGETWSGGAGYSDCLILKLNKEGELLWRRVFGDHDSESIRSVAELPDGSLVSVGYTYSYAGGLESDFLLLKMDQHGNLSWVKTFGGMWSDYFRFILPNEDRLIVIGESESYSNDITDPVILGLDFTGSYEGCLFDTIMGSGTCNLEIISPQLTPVILEINWTAAAPLLERKFSAPEDICEPTDMNEKGASQKTITCFPFGSGMVFNSGEPVFLTVYSCDGRTVFSGHIGAGKTFLQLRSGVYFWKANSAARGPESSFFKGKAVVR